MSPSPLLPVENNPSPPLQLNVAGVGSRNVSCSANKSEKSNPIFLLNGLILPLFAFILVQQKLILNSSGTEDFQKTVLGDLCKANMTNFPMRETFAEAVVNSFTLSGKVTVQHWACCLEEHENTSGQYYHMCFKLSGPKRWNPVKNHLMSNHQIIVNFSESHQTYCTEFEKWRAVRGSVGGVLAWVAWVACLRGWHASVGDVGGVLAWVAC